MSKLNMKKGPGKRKKNFHHFFCFHLLKWFAQKRFQNKILKILHEKGINKLRGCPEITSWKVEEEKGEFPMISGISMELRDIVGWGGLKNLGNSYHIIYGHPLPTQSPIFEQRKKKKIKKQKEEMKFNKK